MYSRRQKSKEIHRNKQNLKYLHDEKHEKFVERVRKTDAPPYNSRFRNYDDELYEGHNEAREVNQQRKKDDRLEEKDAWRSMRQSKDNISTYEWRDERDAMGKFDNKYEFIREIVSKLDIFEKKIDNIRHKDLQSLSLSVLVYTEITKIKDLLRGIPEHGYYFKLRDLDNKEDNAVFREFRQKKNYFSKNMSKVATKLLQLHQRISLIYVVEGRDASEVQSWRDFDRSCSKMSSYFREEAEALGIDQNLWGHKSLSNLLTLLKGMDNRDKE